MMQFFGPPCICDVNSYLSMEQIIEFNINDNDNE